MGCRGQHWQSSCSSAPVPWSWSMCQGLPCSASQSLLNLPPFKGPQLMLAGEHVSVARHSPFCATAPSANSKASGLASQAVSCVLTRRIARQQPRLPVKLPAWAPWSEGLTVPGCVCRLLLLDMLLGNPDRFPCEALGWRGNPNNVLYCSHGRLQVHVRRT